jgi:3-hydroxyacyl-CoA dehydrogenase
VEPWATVSPAFARTDIVVLADVQREALNAALNDSRNLTEVAKNKLSIEKSGLPESRARSNIGKLTESDFVVETIIKIRRQSQGLSIAIDHVGRRYSFASTHKSIPSRKWHQNQRPDGIIMHFMNPVPVMKP